MGHEQRPEMLRDSDRSPSLDIYQLDLRTEHYSKSTTCSAQKWELPGGCETPKVTGAYPAAVPKHPAVRRARELGYVFAD